MKPSWDPDSSLCFFLASWQLLLSLLPGFLRTKALHTHFKNTPMTEGKRQTFAQKHCLIFQQRRKWVKEEKLFMPILCGQVREKDQTPSPFSPGQILPVLLTIHLYIITLLHTTSFSKTVMTDSKKLQLEFWKLIFPPKVVEIICKHSMWEKSWVWSGHVFLYIQFITWLFWSKSLTCVPYYIKNIIKCYL